MDTGIEVVRQERQDSGVTRPAIQHNDNVNFLVNILSLHNYKTIRQLVDHYPECFAPWHSPLVYPEICLQAVASLKEKEKEKGRTKGKQSKNTGYDSESGPGK
jgi:hypothetical protein